MECEAPGRRSDLLTGGRGSRVNARGKRATQELADKVRALRGVLPAKAKAKPRTRGVLHEAA